MALSADELRSALGARPILSGDATSREVLQTPDSSPPQQTISQKRKRSSSTRRDDAAPTLPHSLEAEQGVIGSIFQDPAFCVPVCARSITPDHFFNPANQTLYRELLAVSVAGNTIDLVSFTIHLRDANLLDKIGGASYVTQVSGFVPSAVALEFYLGTLRSKYLLRRLYLGAQSLQSKALEHDADPKQIVAYHLEQTEQLRLISEEKIKGVENFAVADLTSFDPSHDETVLLGGARRWLGRGYTSLWAAPAGAGKSTLEIQLALYWAVGSPCFGIAPVRPLKSLIVQAENDLGDTAEQFQGVVKAIEASGDFKLNGEVSRMIVVNRVIGQVGNAFLACLRALIDVHKPDLVWIDPLFAFAGCDLIDTEAVSNFLRNGLIPIAVESQTCIHVIHHATKTSPDAKSKSHWAEIDYQYLGFGSSEIQNAFRAVNVLIPVSGQENVYRLILSKRGSRAGATDTDGEPATSLYLCHSKDGILWCQVEKPTEPEKRRGKGFIKEFSLDDLFGEMSVAHGFKTSDLQKHVCTETGMSRATFYRMFDEAKAKSKIRLSSDGWIIAPHGSLTQVSNT